MSSLRAHLTIVASEVRISHVSVSFSRMSSKKILAVKKYIQLFLSHVKGINKGNILNLKHLHLFVLMNRT